MEWYRTFFDFWKRALCRRSGIFYESNSQKLFEFGHTHAANTRQIFHFQKGTLKMYIFCIKFSHTFLLLQRTNAQKKIQNLIKKKYFFETPKWTNLFLTWSKKKLFLLSFSQFLAYKQTKEQILFNAKPLKIINNFFAHFWGYSQNFQRSCAKPKSNIS